MLARLLVLATIAACSDRAPPGAMCERAVSHVIELVNGSDALAAPNAAERAAQDVVAAQARHRCEAEGLSEAQADCILAAHEPDWADQLLACKPIADKRPSWLVLPPALAKP